MELTRRLATEADEAFVRGTNKRAYEDVVTRQFGKWDEKQQEAGFDDKWKRAAFDVVELAGERVGAIWVTDEGEYLWLREVFLDPDYQQRGIGTQLVTEELGRARGLHKPLRLRVLRESRARVLYTRLGFVLCGETATHFWMEAV